MVRKNLPAIILVVALVALLVVAWLFSDKDGRHEQFREAVGTPVTVRLAFDKTLVTVEAEALRAVTPDELAEGGYDAIARLYDIDLETNDVWVVEYTVARTGEGTIDPYQVGASKWRGVTEGGAGIRSSLLMRPSEPCEPVQEWTEPRVAGCAYFLVPADEVLSEVQFTAVDRSRLGRRSLPAIERYVTWEIER